ncbi:ESPR-type extended signal peptide-containing protein [Megasphaera sp.]|uniref:ESPR-type extended signal peptide-containing protein n=1 Tax=Megasphaera sp. TaxID=2023260 RepID=UPI0025BD84E3|nr:ESPR-type extended signal peptide-containing protein [Megasphaera sp.]MCF0153657.1 YadA-like family protein [Megasphaera sp.]
MNKIFKVIWSKSRNCYVVASELAKGTSKSTSTGRMAKRAALAAVAALLLFPAGIGTGFAAYSINTTTVTNTSGTKTSVITGDADDAKAISGAIMRSVNNATDIGGLQNAMQSVEVELAQHQSVIDNLGTDKLTLSSDNTLQKESYDSTTKTTTTTDATGLKVAGPISAESGKITNSLEVGHNVNVGGAVNAGSVNSRGNLNVDGNALVKGTLTSQSTINGKEIVSQTNITANNKVVGMKGVVDNTLTGGNYVTAGNTVGENIVALDTQVKANADAIGEEARKRKYSVTNLENADKQLQTNIDNEAAAREAADKALTNRIAAEETDRAEADTALQNAIEKEAADRKAADTTLQTNIDNEAAARKAADDALDSRTTALEDKTEAITYDKDSKTVMVDGKLTATEGITDGTMQDGKYVKLDKYVGQNLNALDQGLQAETSARVTADAKLAEAVNNGLSLGDGNVLQKNTTSVAKDGTVSTSKEAATTLVMNEGKTNQITLNENGIKVGTNSSVMDKDGVYTGGDTYSEAKAAMSADGKIKGANGAFTVDENGNVTSKATITGETVTDGKGASMSNGTVTGKTLTDGIATITNGNINTSGTITGGTVTSTGNISALGDIHAGGAITGASASIQGALTAGSATITGDLTAGGAIQGKSISDGTATMQNGNLTGVKNLSAETITTSGDATIGGDLTVKGKLNVDEIDLTKSGIVGDNNVTASTKVAAGEITSYQKATSTKDGSEKESAIDYDENGTSTWAKATDADDNWNKSTLTVEGSDVTSKVIDSDKNSNLSKQTSTQSQSTLTDAYKNTNTATQSATESSSTLTDKDGKTSTFKQRVDEILNQINSSDTVFSKVDQKVNNITSEVTDGTNSTKTEQNATDITNTASNGTISNIADKVLNQGTTSVTSQIGDGSAIKSVMNADGIANTATGKSITNDAADITNTGTNSVTNQVGSNKVVVDTTGVKSAYGDNTYTIWNADGITNSTDGKMTTTVGGDMSTTVTGKVTEDYKSDLDTKVGGNETHYVAGNQTNTVSGDRTVNVKGTETENFNAQVTNIKTDQKTSVGGNQTNIVAGNQQNTVSGSKTETVKGSVTEKYGSQATTVDGDQSTHVGGNQSNVVAGDQTNTISGSKTETVKGAVTENYGSQSTTVNGDQSTTVKGNQSNTVEGTLTETVTGDVTEDYKANLSTTVGGNQTTTVTGDSSLSAKNITNTATKKLSNSATDIENNASNSILNQVGDNTSWKMTDGKVVEAIKGADGQTNTTTTTADDTYQSVQNGNNVLAKRTSSTNDNLNITDGTNTYSKITTATSNKQTVTDGTETASTNLTKSASNTYITNGTQTVTNHIAADTTNTVMNEGSNGSRQEQTASQILNRVTDGTNTSEVTQNASEVSASAKNITNTASEKITNQIGDGSAVKSEMTADGITNTATKITNITGNTTVTSDTTGTTFENTAHNTALTEMTKHESGDFKKTTISGNTLTTGQATMDYAEVMKDLGVHGNATVDGDTTLGKEGADTKLTVNSKSTFKDTVKMENTLEVDGASTFKDKVTVTNGGLDVNGGTTTDTLKVTGESTFGGKATFKDVVTMEKDLSVRGSMTASSYKVGDKTYIDASGINANSQKVVNVAPGRIAADSTDAINGSQLYQTNERVTGVENKVNKLDSRVDKVGANAAALANLHPLEFDADSKWNIAAAVGGYKGETATAIGAFYRPNENVMVNVSSSFGTGENMYGGGISLRIGQGGNKARRNATNGLTDREKAMQKQIDSLTNRLDALLSVINPNMSKDFPDVPENHWAYEAVSKLAGNGVIQGYEDGKYHGDRTMTRYEMAEIIYNALSKGAKAEKKLVEEFKPELQAMAAQKKA